VLVTENARRRPFNEVKYLKNRKKKGETHLTTPVEFSVGFSLINPSLLVGCMN
jgi:hypothetical protein